jgi:hypothetical protein
MINNYVCRVQYNNGSGTTSKVYLFQTSNFGSAEALALSAARNEASYVSNAWCSSVKRKYQNGKLDKTAYTATYTKLYRCTLRGVYNELTTKPENISFLFAFAPSATDAELLNYITGGTVDGNGAVEFNIADARYVLVTVLNAGTLNLPVTTVKFTFELGRKSRNRTQV